MKSFFRKFLYPKWGRILYYRLLSKKKVNQCIEFLQDSKYKNILIMDTIPHGTCFKQRPHHISEFLSKEFDITLYKSSVNKDFEFLNNKILLCPMLGFKKLKNKNIVYYIDSINEGRDYKHLIKMKKFGYKIVYDYIDEFSNQICKTKKPYTIYKNLEKIDPDLIIASSDKMYSDMEKRFPKDKIVLAKNGASPEDFIKDVKGILPKDIQSIVSEGKPIVGYYGVIARWLDYDLLSKAAEFYNDYNFVFIGKDSQLCTQKLKMHNNVYFLGRKEYEELPQYAQYFDCCVIPFKKGKLAKATSPVKLFEYMALKKPIVCTRDLDECRGYEGVLMSNDDEEFINNLSTAIKISKDELLKEKLYNCAKENSWEKRAENIYSKMRNL